MAKKKSKKKKISYKKYRKNPKRNIIDRYYHHKKIINLNDDSIEELINDIEEEKRKLELKKNKNFRMIAILSILLILLVSFILIFLNYPFIELISKNTIILEYNTEYVEPGVKGVQFFHDITSSIKITDNIDINKVGVYQVIYSYPYLGFNISKKRIVKVVDTKKPEIQLNGDEDVYICPNGKYEEEGFSATDEYDGDITNKVVRIENEDFIDYIVKDSSENQTTIRRNIIKEDKEAPKIELSGNETIYLIKGTTYKESGYQAIDNCDGDITNKVEVKNSIDTSTPGTYKIKYQVSDSNGNTTTKERTIIVTEPRKDGTGVIYLTFDDGPSNSITPKLLDILKDEGVKATFFVIGTSSSFDSLVRREYQEGHTVALHSYTHKYNIVYQSAYAYFNDLNQIRNKVYQVTGEYSNIIRFPGGSSNTVSKKYSLGIMSTLTNQVGNYGYHYFDWNISSGDAGGVNSSEEVYQNVVNNLSHNRSNVILMHDFENNYYTLNAIKDIIEYGKNNGYTFERITMDTKEVHHSVAN